MNILHRLRLNREYIKGQEPGWVDIEISERRMYMRQKIIETLDRIEKQENIKILLAVESGSRAWGFASPDSDYDVRFIYIRKLEDYLRLDPIRDVVELPIDEELDQLFLDEVKR